MSEDRVKDIFYDHAHEVLRKINKSDKILLMGDFNARVGCGSDTWDDFLGAHGVGKCNENGLRLLTLCAEHQLTITNTRFQLRQMHKTMWMHPRSKQWHQLDHIIVRQRDVAEVQLTKVMEVRAATRTTG